MHISYRITESIWAGANCCPSCRSIGGRSVEPHLLASHTRCPTHHSYHSASEMLMSTQTHTIGRSPCIVLSVGPLSWWCVADRACCFVTCRSTATNRFTLPTWLQRRSSLPLPTSTEARHHLGEITPLGDVRGATGTPQFAILPKLPNVPALFKRSNSA